MWVEPCLGQSRAAVSAVGSRVPVLAATALVCIPLQAAGDSLSWPCHAQGRALELRLPGLGPLSAPEEEIGG